MHVVSDADILIHLSKLQKLSLLQSLYKEVAIPDYIKFEILVKENTEVRKALDTFLKVFTISEDKAQVIAQRQ